MTVPGAAFSSMQPPLPFAGEGWGEGKYLLLSAQWWRGTERGSSRFVSSTLNSYGAHPNLTDRNTCTTIVNNLRRMTLGPRPQRRNVRICQVMSGKRDPLSAKQLQILPISCRVKTFANEERSDEESTISPHRGRDTERGSSRFNSRRLNGYGVRVRCDLFCYNL